MINSFRTNVDLTNVLSSDVQGLERTRIQQHTQSMYAIVFVFTAADSQVKIPLPAGNKESALRSRYKKKHWISIGLLAEESSWKMLME